MKAVKKMLAAALAAAIAVTCVVPAYAADPSEIKPGADEPMDKAEVVADAVNGTKPVVSTSSDGTAKLDKVKGAKKKESVTVSKKVTVDGVKYTVTVITKDAFAECKKMKELTVPSTVKTVAKGALNGAAKLKNLALKGTPVVKSGALKGAVNLKKITLTNKAEFKKGAFKGLDTKKMKIVVRKNMSAKKFKAYKKELRAAGFKGTIKMA